MTNMSRFSFINEVKQTNPPCKFIMPHFTFFKGDKNLERHLKHYRSVMNLYTNKNAIMCKIFAMTYEADARLVLHPITTVNPKL